MAASKPAPAMTANRSPLNRPTSRGRRSPRRPTASASSMSPGMPRLVANRFAGPAGGMGGGGAGPAPAGGGRGDWGAGAGEGVAPPLHEPVAAPGDQELGTVVERASHLWWRLGALPNL